MLEPGQPVERLQSMLSDVSAALILHTGHDHDDVSAPESCFSSALLNISAVSLTDMNQANPVITLNPQDCAYVVFTSGSSGQPKGVLVTHGNIHSITASWASAYRLKRTDIHCQMATIGFDVFCGDWVRALCHGAQLVLCDKNTLLNIPLLYQTLQDNAVTIAEFVPTVLHKLMDYLVDSGQKLDFMNTIIVGSERWTIADYWRLRSLAGDKTRIINSYGTSETTVDTSFFDLGELEQPSHPEQSQTAIPIGKPFDNSCVFVLDNKMQPVATGIIGEMYIGGQGISSGYANNPEQTARCFIESPLTNELKQRDGISSRLYRTGDLVKWDHLGNLHLTGRRDSQVKIRGHRIELGEIEAVISRNDSVSRAVAAVCSDPGGQQQICIYYELRPDCQLESETLHSAAAKALPSYMIPRYYQVVTHIPELANGKTDFNNLPKPEFKRTAKQFSRPGTWYETEMADIWSDMLGVKSISLYDDFFELGGNSLYLIELTIKIQQRFTIKINVSELFRLSTLLGMACIVEDIVTGKTTGSKPYISYNDTAAKKLFSFPPAGGYSIVYKTIAEAVPEINIVSFNYLMEQDKVDRYVQMIEQIQPEGPYQLFGYSLGGNLAFEVCKCLEARGHVVENVIIMDAYCITDTVEITEKHIEEFRQELKGHLQKHTGSDIVQAHTMEQANSYIEFIYQQKNIGQTVATVHYIVEKNDNDPNRVHKLASWNDSSTNGTQVYIGACGHEDMLIGEHAGVHGKIIETILRPPVFIKRDSDLLPVQKIPDKSQNDERRVTATSDS
ncbi:MAG: AMP-binding protein [Gammaproteobacteria bacterium]|nr:AMP-binding protein [Gammaproteobacteria bacterium]